MVNKKFWGKATLVLLGVLVVMFILTILGVVAIRGVYNSPGEESLLSFFYTYYVILVMLPLQFLWYPLIILFLICFVIWFMGPKEEVKNITKQPISKN